MAEASANHDSLIADFVDMTGVTPQVAQEHLASSSWDYQSAVTEFYNPPEEIDQASEASSPGPSVPQPIPTTSRMPSDPAQPKKKFATLGDLGSGGGRGHEGHGHEDDDSDGSDENQDLYAGGEKSGLAVENPDDLKRKIVERAKKNAARPGGDDPRATNSRFTGTARTLGGDDAPSQVIEDPNASQQPGRELVERRLHFWADGFSVDDGPLFRSDDPANAPILEQIKRGRAPLGLLNVGPDQEVDVKLEQHPENYVQPKKKYTPFGGGGQRLGSPTLGISGAVTQTEKPSASAAATSASSAASAQSASVDVNEDLPIISLQIRLGDGTRLSSRFNTTHTIGDVYSFVNSSSPTSRSRSWILMTTFPSKELNDKSQVLGDLAEFKRGGVVVQKWQ